MDNPILHPSQRADGGVAVCEPAPAPAVMNRLLARLGPAVLAALRPHIARVPLEVGDVLVREGEEPESVYFIERGLVALAVPVDGTAILAALLGRDAMIDPAAVLGLGPAAHRAVVQIRGQALRMPLAEARRIAALMPEFDQLLTRYLHARIGETGQRAACHARHSIVQRLVSWIAGADELLEGQPIPVTHEAIAQLLGVRRAGVTVSLHHLEGEHAIYSRRGRIAIRERARLDALACGCHERARAELRALWA